MKNIKPLLIILFLFPLSIFAQTPDSLKTWKHEARFSLGINQAAFSENWSGGGTNSIGITAAVVYTGKWKKNKWGLNDVVDLQYGFVDIDGTGYRKTIDKIYIDAALGYDIGKKWSATLSGNFLTQFAPGYKYEKDSLDREQAIRISDFMAPGYLTFGIGFEYKPADFFSLRISPYAPRITFVTDTTLYLTVPDNYGVEIGETTRFENGLQIFADFDKEIMKNLTLQAKYLGYLNYEKDIADMDHRIDLLLGAKVNELIKVGFTGIMVYDTDQDKDIQWNQALVFNFTYTLRNFTPAE